MSEESVTAQMSMLAQEAVTVAREKFHSELDLSPDSLTALESILALQHAMIPRGMFKWFRRAPSDEQLQKMSVLWGAYLGEVIRLQFGGEWSVPDEGPMAGTLCLVIGQSCLSPPSRVYKRLVDGPADDVAVYFSMLKMQFEGDGGLKRPDPND